MQALQKKSQEIEKENEVLKNVIKSLKENRNSLIGSSNKISE